MATTRTRFNRRHRRGASHILTVTIQLPLLIIMIATVVEVSLILLTKNGLEYSVAATARAASVWLPAEGSVEERLERIRIAANSSFAPFASGRELHANGVPADSGSQVVEEAFQTSLSQFAGRSPDSDWLKQKIRYCRQAMRIRIKVYADQDPRTGLNRLVSSSGHVEVDFVGRRRQDENDFSNPRMDVYISYEKPIDLPGIGAFMGGRASWPGAKFYTSVFERSCSWTLEGFRSTNQKIGVNYNVFE